MNGGDLWRPYGEPTQIIVSQIDGALTGQAFWRSENKLFAFFLSTVISRRISSDAGGVCKVVRKLCIGSLGR